MHFYPRTPRISLDHVSKYFSFNINNFEDGISCHSKIANLSRSGMCLEANSRIPLVRGTSIHFVFDAQGYDLDGTKGIARVCWVDANRTDTKVGPRFGIELLEFHGNAERYYYEFLERELFNLKISSIMDSCPPPQRPDTPIRDVLSIFQNPKTEAIAVVNQDGTPLGVFTKSQIASLTCRNDVPDQALGLHMTPDITLINAEDTLGEIHHLVSESRVDQIPIVEDGAFVGLLSVRELIRYWTHYLELKLARVSVQRDRAIGLIAHDLRTPTSLIHTSNQILSKGQIHPEEYLRSGLADQVIHHCEAMLGAMDEILDLQKIQEVRIRLNYSILDIDDLVESVCVAFTTIARIKRVAIVFKSGGPLPMIKGDRQRLEQVFFNLISNAIKSSSEGSQIVLGTRLMHSKVSVWVADHGEGIRPDNLDDFIDESVGERPDGPYGPAITKKIVEAHNGNIELSSKIGLGSTVTITLPISDLQ